jgi:hypothetical protein
MKRHDRGVFEAMAWARAERTPLGTVIDSDDLERQHATVLAGEIERLQSELDNERGHREADNRESRAEIERQLTESLRDTIAARTARNDIVRQNIRLQTKLDAAIDALQSLFDWQNGAPLESPRWLAGWGGAMARAEKVLKASRPTTGEESHE